MSTEVTKHARLNFRLQQEHKELIEQAARSLGQSISDFAIAALLRDARQTLEQTTTTRLTVRDQEVFLKMLDSQTPPNEALQDAAARYRERR